MAKRKATAEQRKAIRNARKIIDQVLKIDGNEAETRRRVERIFEELMGYNVFKHLSRERAVQGPGETEHVDFAIQFESGSDARPIVMVELKRVGIGLAKKHLKQVTSYGIDAGCEWVLLTNGKEWKIYHIEFGKPPKVELLEKWDLLEDDITDLVFKFDLLSFKSVKRDGLDKLWKRVKVLAPKTLLSAVFKEDSLSVIRKNLRKDTGILVDNEEVYIGITKLLNEAAAASLKDVSITKPTKMKRGPRKKKEKVEEEKKPEPEMPTF